MRAPRRPRLGEDLLLRLRTEAGHVADALRLAGDAQLVDRRDAERVEQLAGGLRADAGQAHDVDEAGRVLRLAASRALQGAGLAQLGDLGGDRVADVASSVSRPSSDSGQTDSPVCRMRAAALR